MVRRGETGDSEPAERERAAGDDKQVVLSDQEADMLIRQALLLQVDALERKWHILPRTAKLRHEAKAAGACAGTGNQI